jgi:hypothetical protein
MGKNRQIDLSKKSIDWLESNLFTCDWQGAEAKKMVLLELLRRDPNYKPILKREGAVREIDE